MCSNQNEGNMITPNEGKNNTSPPNIDESLASLKTFMMRRFDELSMEINATAQQVDMAEDHIAQRFSDILSSLSAINYSDDSNELKTVLDETQRAAQTILDATERMKDHLDPNQNDWNIEETRGKLLSLIDKNIQIIIVACTFHELSRQRIENTLHNLNRVEKDLNTTLKHMGISIDLISSSQQLRD